MYKHKKNWKNFIFIIALVITFVILFIFIICSNLLEYSKKLELCIQLGGMFFTSFALLLTYNSLKNEKEQKHITSRPYLVLNDIDFCSNSKNKCLEFDYHISNIGLGIATNITIKIIKEKDKKIIYEKSFIRLEVDSNSIVDALYGIRSEITHLVDKNTSYMNFNGIMDDFEVDDIKTEDYKKLVIEIFYYDVYGKKYKNTMYITLNDDNELDTIEEEIKEF